jgi:hypothetical protein
MTKTFKLALLAAISLAGASAAQAQTYTPGDLLVGFTTGTGNDLLYDLGQASSLTAGETFPDLSTLLGTDFGTGSALNNVNWGVVGYVTTGHTTYTTTAVGFTPDTITGTGAFNAPKNAVNTLVGNFLSSPTPGASATVAYSSSTSYYAETIGNQFSTDYGASYENPDVVGPNTATLSSVLNDGSAPTALYNLTLGPDDSFTVAPAPEPSTYALLGGAGLLVLALRKQLVRKQA